MLSLLTVILSGSLVETLNENRTAGNMRYVEGKSHWPLVYLLTAGTRGCMMDDPYY